MKKNPPTPPASVIVGFSDTGGEPCCAHAKRSRTRIKTSHKLWLEYVLAPRPSRLAKLEAAVVLKCARSLWHRFADSGTEFWSDEVHKSEYIMAAEAVLGIARRALASRKGSKTRRKP